METKVCAKCGEEKELGEFYKTKTVCKTCIKKHQKDYYSNPENNLKKKEYNKKYHANEEVKVKRQKYRKEYSKQYYTDPKKREERKIKYQKRLKEDLNFQLGKYLRNRLYSAIKGKIKIGSAVKDLGCTVEELKTHLESLFQPRMSWDNYGAWHIDHIKPLASFNLEDPEQVKVACHYSNLQPLWAEDNLKKGDR